MLVGIVLASFEAPGEGRALVDNENREMSAESNFSSYTPPLEHAIDPIAPETATFAPGFRVQSLFLDGGSPFSGRIPPQFTGRAGSEPATRLSHAALETRQARAAFKDSPGLPIGSHGKIASARRKWLERSAAMERLQSNNATKVEVDTTEGMVSRPDGVQGVELDEILGGRNSDRNLNWIGGMEFLVRRVGAVLGLIPKGNRRSHMVLDSDKSLRALHPAALVPFQTDPLWNNAALAAGTETWRGYGSDPERDSSTTASSALFQAAIQQLVNTPIGGIALPEDAIRPWSWNTPTTGGLTMTIFGMGFGYSSIRCPQQCLEAPEIDANCPLKTCLFIESSVGDTLGDETAWLSDSSIAMVVPPGIGDDLAVNVTIGRFKMEYKLFKRFSYDSPSETRISPGNSRLAGNVTVTVYGSNFGTQNPMASISLGESSCTSAIWVSDSQVICSKVIPGTGALLNAKVAIEGRPSENPPGISRVFSFDRPVITGVYPGNAPPAGFSVITLLGQNFGAGPDTRSGRLPNCPNDSPNQYSYVLKPRENREAICGTGFALPVTKRFQVRQPNFDEDGEVAEEGVLNQLRWDNIRPHSLAHDPVACIINEYLCTYKGQQKYCEFIRESCMALSNKTVSKLDAEYMPMVSFTEATTVARPKDGSNSPKWYAVGGKEAGCANLPDESNCPARVVSTYIKDGVNCDMIDQTDPVNPVPYFEKNNIYTTNYLCNMSPRPLGGCSTCARLGCCNRRGTYGARISGSECVTLRWMSDSSLACRLSPGIGPGHFVMVAIDDYEGVAVAMKERLFSFDIPTVSTLTRGSGPTTGGKSYTLLGTDFGTFACNRTWCSFDEELFRCNATRCSKPGEPDSSTIVSHQASLQATYDMSTVFRTACAGISWTSDTALSCTVAPGTGDLRVVEMTVFRSYNHFAKDLSSREVDKAFLYHTPTMTKVEPTNLGANSGKNVTIFGTDFGMWDTQPKARMSGTACIETYWISDTIIKCKAPLGLPPPPCRGVDGATTDATCKEKVCNTCPNGLSSTVCNSQYDTHHQIDGQGVCRSVVVTVDRLRGYLTEAFSYEGAVITGLNPTNGPPTGGFNITMQGESFGDNPQYDYSGQIGESGCSLMSWYSDTAVACSMVLGIGFGHIPRLGK